MDSKKYPGKFTVRFNLADPQQQQAVDLLNKQGRFKARFLTNAILLYVRYSRNPEMQSSQTLDRRQIEQVVQDILAQQQNLSQNTLIRAAAEDSLESMPGIDKDAILQTLQTFQHSQ